MLLLRPQINVSIFNIVILIKSFPSTVTLSPNSVRSPVLKNFGSQTTLAADGRSGDESLDEIVSVMMTPKTGNRLHVPREVLRAQVEPFWMLLGWRIEVLWQAVNPIQSSWIKALKNFSFSCRTASLCLLTLTVWGLRRSLWSSERSQEVWASASLWVPLCKTGLYDMNISLFNS